jgi:hypothetical protein
MTLLSQEFLSFGVACHFQQKSTPIPISLSQTFVQVMVFYKLV